MRRVWVWCCLVTMLVTGVGCGGGGGLGKNAAAPTGGTSAGYGSSAPPADVAESAPGGGGGEAEEDSASASSAPPPAAAPRQASEAPSGGASASIERSYTPPATTPTRRERPGLGTEWGETRSSHVHDVSFVRSDEDRPFAVAQLFYNDRRGVDALVSYHQSRSVVRDFTTAGGAITVSIIGSDGEPLEGDRIGDRSYVVGEQGQRYSIALTNHTGHRFEAVATVDGLDVINGRDGTLSNRGYVLMPFATLEIDGFRQSQDAVAAFRFARVADSYAAQTGKARNVGVIGVAFFAERGDAFLPYTENELRTRDTASPFPGADPRFARPPR